MKKYFLILCMFSIIPAIHAQDCSKIKAAVIGTDRQAAHIHHRFAEKEKSPMECLNVNVFPNPADSYVTIVSQTECIKEIRIYNSTGRMVLHQYYKDLLLRRQLNLSTLNKGFYLLRIKLSDQTTIICKIIKK